VYLPADRLTAVDHVGQLSAVYVAEGKLTSQAPRQCGACAFCCDCVGHHDALVPVGWKETQSTVAMLEALLTYACLDLYAGFATDNFRLRLGSGAGSAFIFNLSATTASIESSRWAPQG
jgi:hypothetical protein